MIIVVVGPTGVGKTKMSIELAKIYNGEIINADSMQIYKGLDIGTAKVTESEKEHIPHHLLDIKEVSEDYSVYDYQIDARKAISKVFNNNHIPILVGGTGYYIKSVLYDYEFIEEDNTTLESDLSDEELSNLIDSYESGITYDKYNRKRMIRLLTKLKNGWKPDNKDFKLIYDDVYFIGLTTKREELYKRIDERFLGMLIPLVDEVKPFILSNVKSKALNTGIGYKEFYPFFNNQQTLSEVVINCQKNSRNYAKRQYTWFNNQMDIKWFDVDYVNFKNTVNNVVYYIENEKKRK